MKWSILEFGEVKSTQVLAHGQAGDGAPEGTVVVAQSQTDGRGRLDRSWVSPAGGLYMSVVLRPRSLSNLQLLPLLAALAVVQGTSKTTRLSPKIRWPNDVMVGAKKVAGTIAESRFDSQALSHVVVGIGVNCNSLTSSMGAAGSIATSIAEELGSRVDTSAVRTAILDSFAALYANWNDGADTVSLARPVIRTLGKEGTVRFRGETVERPFKAIEILADGGLRVEIDSIRNTLYAEDIEWLRESL